MATATSIGRQRRPAGWPTQRRSALGFRGNSEAASISTQRRGSYPQAVRYKAACGTPIAYSGPFRSRRCSVTFRRFAHQHGLDGACGSLEIAPQLESETFEVDGEEVVLQPIVIYIVLDDGGYDRTEQLLRDCLSAGREASLSLRFSHWDLA